jgi:ribonuclease BN (tRNA processing enzyme)
MTYSADTSISPALVDLARGSEVFLCEATWSTDPTLPPDVHLTGRQAGEHAARAGVGRLLLTHLSPFADPAVVLAEAREGYAGPLGLARRDETYDV